MQIKKIATLVGFACVAMAGSAQAAGSLPVGSTAESVVNDAVTNGRVIFISGASAVQKGFSGIIAKLFDSTTVAPIYFGGGNNASNLSKSDYVGVAGVLGASAGTWAGQNAIIIDRTVGGSVWGVDPVARDTKIPVLKVTSSNCGSIGAGTYASPYVCDVSSSDATGNTSPDAGVSDIAPALFKDLYNTEGETAATQLTDDELALLTSTPIYGLEFGVPVTSNVPSSVKFNKAIVGAILAGNIGTWDKVDSSLAALGDIVVCRRVPGSGTQSVYNLYFNGYPCAANVNAPADRNSNKTTGATPTYNKTTKTYNIPAAAQGRIIVVENSTSGDVKTCLDKAVNGGSYTTADRSGTANAVTVNFNGTHAAIATLSLDSLANSRHQTSGTADRWSYRSLNGAGTYVNNGTGSSVTTVTETGTGLFPNLANYLDGSWDFQGWISFNVPARTAAITEKAEVLADFVAKAQDPTILASINALRDVSAAVPAPYSPYTPVGYNVTTSGGITGDNQILHGAYLLGDQCAPYTRDN